MGTLSRYLKTILVCEYKRDDVFPQDKCPLTNECSQEKERISILDFSKHKTAGAAVLHSFVI